MKHQYSDIVFTKMHGTGNDFVVVEKSSIPTNADYSALALYLCDRKFGIGSDGLLIIAPDDEYDFKMIFHNPDGSLAEMCGNGIRCLGKYVFEHKLTDKTELKIRTKAGVIALTLGLDKNSEVEWVEAAMGKADFTRANIPVAGNGETALAEMMDVCDGLEIEFHAVSMGNPHAVILVDDVDKYPVRELGPIIETHELFPSRINVEFVQYLTPEKIKIRIWERGAGETLSCGTGICASCAVIKRLGLSASSMEVEVPGGTLLVRFGNDDIIYLKGPAVEVFTGKTS